MTVKRSTPAFLACSLLVALLNACSGTGEKADSLATGSVREALPVIGSHSAGLSARAGLSATNRVYRARAAQVLEAIRAEAKLPDLELKRLTTVAQTAAHAQSLIDTIEDPIARERARNDLGMAVDRSLGSHLNSEQAAIVHRHILATNNP